MILLSHLCRFYCSIGLRDVAKLLAIIINRVYVEHELLKV